jgi:DNA-binding transcriptional LysR family regulator
MILYIHLQDVDYIDCHAALIATANIYNMTDLRRVIPDEFPPHESLYMYVTKPEDGENVQRFIEWMHTRAYCKEISVE